MTDVKGFFYPRTATGRSSLIPTASGSPGRALVDIDDTIIEVHGYAKQGSGYGYSGATPGFVDSTRSWRA